MVKEATEKKVEEIFFERNNIKQPRNELLIPCTGGLAGGTDNQYKIPACLMSGLHAKKSRVLTWQDVQTTN